jgi:hypothetical protein
MDRHQRWTLGLTSLKELAYQGGQTVYRIRRGLPHDYLVQQLKAPTVHMILA